MPHASAVPRVAILGAGPVGCATAAFLHERGIAASIWSPTAQRVRHSDGSARIVTRGALAVDFAPVLLHSAAELAHHDVWLVCLPANAYESVLGEATRHWRDGHTVIVSGALSLVSLWLAERAAAQGRDVRVAGWNTTATTTHFLPDGALHVNPLRERIEVAAGGAVQTAQAVALCESLLGPRFAGAANLLAITLANINPIAHAAEVIPNLTRMDRAEAWSLFGCFTPVVARMAEALDAERLAVARAFGLALPTLREHYARSYHLTPASLHEMAAEIVARGMSPNGPAHLAHRYVLEDAPFGMAFLESLGRAAQVPTPVHTSCVTLLQAIYARHFRAENFLATALLSEGVDASSLLTRCAAERSAEISGRRALSVR